MADEDKNMSWKKLFALFFCFFAYLFIGAAIFHFLESDNEQNVRFNLRDAKRKLITDHDCMLDDTLEDFLKEVKKAISSGIDPLGNATNPTNWDYASAFFFSGTVVTTIGYGKTVPTTDWGRNICLLYALLGIPFTGWLLATIGNFYCEYFQRMAKSIEKFLHNKIGFKQKLWRKFLLYIFVFSVSYSVIVLVPSIVFYHMEHWSFDEAHYYSFVTLSTIGFGDYVASVDSQHPKNQGWKWVYDIAVACWYVFGLAYLACLITAISKKQKHTITKLRTSVSLYTGRKDPEPPIGFGLSDVDVNAETSLNQKILVQNGCTCAHNQTTVSVTDMATQTD